MEKDSGQVVRLEIDSQLSNTTLIATAIRGISSLTTLSELEVNRIELCVVEIVNNVIEHSYDYEAGHKVEVLVNLLKTAFILTVNDWGQSIPHHKLDTNDLSVDPDDRDSWKSSGRGLAIVQNLMDDVTYKTVGNKNSFIMRKNIASDQPPVQKA